MMFNPLNIAVESPGGLVAAYAATLALVLAVSSAVLAACPRRRAWARRNKMRFALVIAAFWMAVLYGGSKGGTNKPPIIKVDGYQIPIFWDAEQKRYIPALVPLRGLCK